jgi:hypothetical protein
MQTEVSYHVQIFVSGRWDNYGYPHLNQDEVMERYQSYIKQYPYMKFRAIRKTVTLEEIQNGNQAR